MSLYQVKQTMDPLERQRIETEKRRLRNIERAKRILHPKTRIMGIDKNALADQVKVKQEAARLESERNSFYDNQAVRHAKIANEHFTKKQNERRKEHQELEFFRVQQINEKRARLAAEEKAKNLPELPTPFLDFAGEDPHINERKKLQQAQQKDWLNQQLDSLKAKETNSAQAQADYDAVQLRIYEIKGKLEADAAKVRGQENRKAVLINRQLAMEKQQREDQAKAIAKRQEEYELQQTLNSDLLTETVHPRLQGGSKKCSDALPYHFKGFSVNQRQEILDIQQQQLQAINAKRAAEREAEEAFNEQQVNIRRQLMLQERQRQQQKVQERASLESTRRVQQKDHKTRTDYLNNTVYQNPVDPSFFQQFGTSCR